MTTSSFAKVRSLLTPSQRRGAVILVGLLVVGMMFETLGIGLVIPTLALMTSEDLAQRYPVLHPLVEALGKPSQAELIRMAMLALVGIYLLKNLFLAFLAWWQTRYAYAVQTELSQRLFTGYLRQPYTFHLQRNSAKLIRNVTTEVGMFADAIMSALLVATESLVLLGVATLLLTVEPVGATIVVLVLGGAAWIFYKVTRGRIARWGIARQYHEGLRMQHLQQGLGGAKDVKLLGRERDFIEQYRVHNAGSSRVSRLQATVQQMPRLWIEFLAIVGLATLVITMLYQGRNMAGVVPTLGLFAAAAFRLMPSTNRVLSGIQALRYNSPVIGSLYEELGTIGNHQEAPSSPRHSGSALSLHTELDVIDVKFAYPGAVDHALEGLSIKIVRGETVGLIGASGSGKSTLVDIILGLLTPSEGTVEIDGQDIQTALRSWQDQIGYVPQSIYLTDDTLRRNVAFGLPEGQIDDSAVARAVQAAQLDKFVDGLPARLNTVVGERGIRLSGGQRQRIGIARALYHDPAVLVLDEATSSLDNATEHGVMQAVMALRGSKTVLIVAHRLTTVQQCDRLYRIEDGKVAAEGKPDEVLRLSKAV
ncbi:MAG TPA: ABC transporter ATP-binding protein [Burkholderiales bacterium]|nr:ABC transporter ATP-binding protein [Burkholderiales bacterium]